jgi:uncharacterized protein (DUF4415 family)
MRKPTGRTAKTQKARRRARKGMDWTRVDATTDADVRRQIAEDPDTAPEIHESWLASARLVTPGRKEPISLRVDPDVLAWFRAQGKGYQTRMTAVLRQYVEYQRARKG